MTCAFVRQLFLTTYLSSTKFLHESINVRLCRVRAHCGSACEAKSQRTLQSFESARKQKILARRKETIGRTHREYDIKDRRRWSSLAISSRCCRTRPRRSRPRWRRKRRNGRNYRRSAMPRGASSDLSTRRRRKCRQVNTNALSASKQHVFYRARAQDYCRPWRYDIAQVPPRQARLLGSTQIHAARSTQTTREYAHAMGADSRRKGQFIRVFARFS